MKRTLIIGGLVVAAAALGVATWVGYRLSDVPALDVHAQPFPETADDVLEHPFQLQVRYLGAASLLFDDGQTAFLVDAFFSRPAFNQVALSPLTPDLERITDVLERLEIEQLDAVVALHADFDHVMDAPTLAELTGARVIGSESVTNVARGHPLPEAQIQLVEDGESLRMGRFELTFIQSRHAPGNRTPGVIGDPLEGPAHATLYRTGTVYSLLVEHEGRRVLVHSSAGYEPGKLDAHQADVVYLGIGDLGPQGGNYHHAYWDEVVAAVEARRVVLTHWDNLFVPLGDELYPAPRLYQHHEPAMESLYALKQRNGVELRLPRVFVAADPFAGLPVLAEKEQRVLERLPGLVDPGRDVESSDRGDRGDGEISDPEQGKSDTPEADDDGPDALPDPPRPV